MAFPTSPVNGQEYDNYIYSSTLGSWKTKQVSNSDILADAGFLTEKVSWPGHDNNWRSTGLNVNNGSYGGTALVIASVNTSTGDSTYSALYLLRMGYDGNNFSHHYVAGNNDFLDFTCDTNGDLSIRGTPGNNTARFIFYT